MTLNQSYTRELEFLIVDVLLPVYDRYYREQGKLPEYTKINADLLRQVVKRKQTPKLFQPKNDSI